MRVKVAWPRVVGIPTTRAAPMGSLPVVVKDCSLPCSKAQARLRVLVA